ncbi:MAG: hypothetical protein V1837_04710 [Candidatus Woesearchaeota archaeon]
MFQKYIDKPTFKTLVFLIIISLVMFLVHRLGFILVALVLIIYLIIRLHSKTKIILQEKLIAISLGFFMILMLMLQVLDLRIWQKLFYSNLSDYYLYNTQNILLTKLIATGYKILNSVGISWFLVAIGIFFLIKRARKMEVLICFIGFLITTLLINWVYFPYVVYLFMVPLAGLIITEACNFIPGRRTKIVFLILVYVMAFGLIMYKINYNYRQTYTPWNDNIYSFTDYYSDNYHCEAMSSNDNELLFMIQAKVDCPVFGKPRNMMLVNSSKQDSPLIVSKIDDVLFKKQVFGSSDEELFFNSYYDLNMDKLSPQLQRRFGLRYYLQNEESGLFNNYDQYIPAKILLRLSSRNNKLYDNGKQAFWRI